MSNEREEFPYGEIKFVSAKSINDKIYYYTLVPYGILVREELFGRIYLFKTIHDFETYFEKENNG